ncbi:MAG: type II toxin-antitoxin system RelE/ParE family toxin [Clostridia bacterium]|nr:type II toxin-antitoxin system RelE/ParE family toxin [Clostridia bacterium]
MKYFFHPEAKDELLKSVDYYEDCQEGLGLEFSQQVFLGIQRILRFPKSWPKFSKSTRSSILNKFPFAILYQIDDDDQIFIIAIMHTSRKPGYWRDRI